MVPGVILSLVQVAQPGDIQVYGPILGTFLCKLGNTLADREVRLEAAREGDIFTGRPLSIEGKGRYFLMETGQGKQVNAGVVTLSGFTFLP